MAKPNPEMSLELWRGMNKLRERLQGDRDLRAQFDKDPVPTLKEMGLDILISAEGDPDEIYLSTHIERLTDFERRAALDTIITMAESVELADIGKVAGVLPIANANAGANANTSGVLIDESFSDLVTRVVLPQDFEQTPLATHMREMQLSAGRQKALLKRVVEDPDSLVSVRMIGDQEIENQTEGQVLRALRRRLARAGYSEYFASFYPLVPRREAWHAHRDDAPAQLRPLLDLLLLGRPVERVQLTPTIGDLIEPLSDLGLLVGVGTEHITTPDLVLLPVLGHWLFCQQPQVNQTLYFGDDSMALLQRLRPELGGSCLDLCAGPGIQTLQCSLFAARVYAVEINPVAAALARLNVAMNGRDATVTVYCGDLYGPIEGQRFDTIVANPPLLPFPEHIHYPFVGHGGANGLRITWRILEGLPGALAVSGIAQIIATCLSDGLLPVCSQDLETWCREHSMDMLLTITGHLPLHPGTSYFDGLVATAVASTGSDPTFVAAAYEQSIAAQGGSHLCGCFFHITHGTGVLSIQDVSRGERPGLWYIL